jgi:ribosome-associated translation inhibitor RaiA
MAMEIRGVPTDRALRARITERLTAALGQVGMERAAAQATFFDENGPKGGLDMRCALTVRLPFRPHIRAEAVAETQRTAFDHAFARLERELERYKERDRESKRHPKKYYTARRLMTAAGEAGGVAPKRKPGRRGRPA